MREAGRIHALALLRENTGNLLGACELWCGLADGKRTEVELREGSFLSGLAGGEEERQRKLVGRWPGPWPPRARGPRARLVPPWLMRRDPQAALGLLRRPAMALGRPWSCWASSAQTTRRGGATSTSRSRRGGAWTPPTTPTWPWPLPPCGGPSREIDRGSAKGRRSEPGSWSSWRGATTTTRRAALKCLSRHPP